MLRTPAQPTQLSGWLTELTVLPNLPWVAGPCYGMINLKALAWRHGVTCVRAPLTKRRTGPLHRPPRTAANLEGEAKHERAEEVVQLLPRPQAQLTVAIVMRRRLQAGRGGQPQRDALVPLQVQLDARPWILLVAPWLLLVDASGLALEAASGIFFLPFFPV